jgi:heterodisulfide reductase subunit C
MLSIIEPIFFAILSGLAFFLAGKRGWRVYKNIMLGKSAEVGGDVGQRIKNVVLIALGQKKMFKNVIPALLHMVIYVSFVITQIELLEIFYDGITHSHRAIFHLMNMLPLLGSFYCFVISFIEVLTLLTLVVTIAFLARRNLLKVPRLNMAELKGWPMKDANLILMFELYLITCIFMMNTGDAALHPDAEYHFLISGLLAQLIGGLPEMALHLIERIGWWGHIIGVLGFLVYLPGSKHLHILLAFPNTYFSSLKPKGEINNLASVTKEIKIMMNPDTAFAAPADANAAPVKFGAKDVMDLSWKNLLDAYSCTECGRCTSACPANQTGKKLSPRKIMMDTRDRLEEVGKNIAANNGVFKDDGKTLLNDYISVEELRACTTCNACVEECPVTISPLEIIVEMRRHLILEESNSPEEWNGMFSNIENNGAPWQFSQQDRLNWKD